MLVGRADVRAHEIVRHIGSVEEFKEYALQLVPTEFQHVQAIVDNQLYLCCLVLRKSDIAWSVKSSIISEVMSNVRVVGYTDVVIEASMLWKMIDKEKVILYANKEFSERN